MYNLFGRSWLVLFLRFVRSPASSWLHSDGEIYYVDLAKDSLDFTEEL